MKRKDFSATLKQLTDCLKRMCSGNRFHSDGAATANERARNFVAVRCTCMYKKFPRLWSLDWLLATTGNAGYSTVPRPAGKLSNFHSTLYTLLTSYVYHLKFCGFLILIYVTIRISILFHVVCRLMQFSATEGILSYGGRFSATLTNQLHKVVEFPPL